MLRPVVCLNLSNGVEVVVVAVTIVALVALAIATVAAIVAVLNASVLLLRQTLETGFKHLKNLCDQEQYGKAILFAVVGIALLAGGTYLAMHTGGAVLPVLFNAVMHSHVSVVAKAPIAFAALAVGAAGAAGAAAFSACVTIFVGMLKYAFSAKKPNPMPSPAATSKSKISSCTNRSGLFAGQISKNRGANDPLLKYTKQGLPASV